LADHAHVGIGTDGLLKRQRGDEQPPTETDKITI